MYNMSGLSLSEMENAMHPPKASLYQQRPHTGKAEFMGIALPVDINMMFEVGVVQSSYIIQFFIFCIDTVLSSYYKFYFFQVLITVVSLK